MDIVTHGLASVALVRAFFPRVTWGKIGFAVIFGTLADADWLSSILGPSAFLNWHKTYTHSLMAAILSLSIIPAALIATFFLRGDVGIYMFLRKGEQAPTDPRAIAKLVQQTFLAAVIGAPLSAALLHIAMDACQSEGVMLFWPFGARRIAADWLPNLDPWILTILIASIALPELFHLINAEIGAKEKRPRGRIAAIVGLILVFAYIGARAILHSNAVALLGSSAYRGEMSRRVAAFPEAVSLLAWHGLVETESSLHLVEVNVAASSSFNPDNGSHIFKPQMSPVLEATQKTQTATQFLRVARFPKASIEKTETGYHVELRDLRYAAAGESRKAIAAVFELDPEGKVTRQELVWAASLRR